MFKHTGLIFTTTLAFMMVCPCRGATKEEILRVNWNKQSLPELKRLIPDQKAAQQFAVEVRLKEPHTERDNIYKLDVESDVVDEYEFVDLKGDGNLEFVCLLDNGGRMRPTRLMVVENDNGQLKTAYLTGGEGGLGLGELRYILKDVKHDGKTEITTSDPLEPSAGGAEPTPYMEHIYVYKGGKLAQSDRSFLDYYKNESLPKCNQELNELLQHPPASNASSDDRIYYQKRLDAKKKEIDALNKIVSER